MTTEFLETDGTNSMETRVAIPPTAASLDLDVDRHQLRWLSGGDLSFEIELLQSFYADAQMRLATLHQALCCQDYTQISNIAHYLKGASGNVGLRTFALQASEIEAQARRQQLAEGHQHYYQLHHQLQQLAAYLNS